jgi:hypothetical protein
VWTSVNGSDLRENLSYFNMRATSITRGTDLRE